MSTRRASPPTTPMMRSPAINAAAFRQGMQVLAMPEPQPWMQGWESNALLGHLVLKQGRRAFWVMMLSFLVQRAVQLMVPGLVGVFVGPVILGCGYLMGVLWLTSTHASTMRPLFGDQLMATPLSAREILQAFVLPPWAIALGMMLPLALVDTVVSAIVSWEPAGRWIAWVIMGFMMRLYACYLVFAATHRLMAILAGDFAKAMAELGAPTGSATKQIASASAGLAAILVLVLLFVVMAVGFRSVGLPSACSLTVIQVAGTLLWFRFRPTFPRFFDPLTDLNVLAQDNAPWRQASNQALP